MESRQNFNRDDDFMCGVVEGFYGRPWTTEQRKDLFQKMKKWGMDSYLYAPKDDYKHRAYWRELYTVEEADHLNGLITAAKENGIRFIYAISPGLDIVYSSSKDVTSLKRKLEQVNQLGCDAFAILFDDIDPEMSKADKEMFKSFAHAQVSVTNEAFQHINVSRFLFCPTQYCATRAVPNVRTSEYLKTIGSKLDLRIDIMWTGPKVISKDVSVESIDEVAEVIRRPPVIWDNLHANDYDQKRLFLGPYAGRSPQLIPRLRGVLTNPNCEYGANFVAIHTLAQWSRCSVDAKKKIEESMNADAKLETETEWGDGHIPENLDPHIYHPLVALRIAIKEWLGEFKKHKTMWGPMLKPQIVSAPIPLIPSVNTCISMTPTTNSEIQAALPPSNVPTCDVLNGIMENGSNMVLPTPTSTVMNSLASENKIVCADFVHAARSNISSSGGVSDSSNAPNASSSGLEPMDTATPPNPSPPEQMVDGQDKSAEDVLMVDTAERSQDISSPDEVAGTSSTSVSIMNLDSESPNTPHSSMQVETPVDEELKSSPEDELNVDDLQLLCDLFYLPFEHGSQGLKILQEFQWLKTNSNIVAGISHVDKGKPEVMEWFDRAMKFEVFAGNLNKLLIKLNATSNRELLYELYPYLWDMRGVVSLLNSYIKWLALGQIPANVTSYVHGSYTWFSKGWREAFTSGDQEPWVIRGGLTSELQRLIPVDRGTDLYMYKAPDMPSSRVYTVRPYKSNDEASIYKICMVTFKDGLSAADELVEFPKLPGDVKLGGFLSSNTDLSFVVEDENEVVVGISVAVLNGKEFRRKLKEEWLTSLRKKYPLSSGSGIEFANSVVSAVHADIRDVPEEIMVNYPAEIRFAILTPLVDPSVPKRLLTCVLAALRANGIFGCYVEVPANENYFVEFHKKIGFTEISPNFMGRTF